MGDPASSHKVSLREFLIEVMRPNNAYLFQRTGRRIRIACRYGPGSDNTSEPPRTTPSYSKNLSISGDFHSSAAATLSVTFTSIRFPPRNAESSAGARSQRLQNSRSVSPGLRIRRFTMSQNSKPIRSDQRRRICTHSRYLSCPLCADYSSHSATRTPPAQQPSLTQKTGWTTVRRIAATSSRRRQ